jgi:hypothetical protein
MQSFMDFIYGPLSSDYCVYFYFLSMFGFILLGFTLILSLYIGITKGKKFEYFLKVGFVCIGYAVFYFQNRLLYHMCARDMIR